ncbi:rna-directed dna polymerase from mobile element jockey-like [Willisornis vidua]|uniref:Rna-directed dna polymerase from mobile element jockey-like n=1 Tax=Willisornis vidua TaxID=1566151 RepID=A0ABQ9D5F7_9PASS|nr:rna-directed dna polymerase from mobile element jockey-like [Willisornis vidua]
MEMAWSLQGAEWCVGESKVATAQFRYGLEVGDAQHLFSKSLDITIPGYYNIMCLDSQVVPLFSIVLEVCAAPVSGVPKGSILSPVLFNIFINNLDTQLEGILSNFSDSTKLGGAVASLKGREALQKDLDKLEAWAITNHRKINKDKCQILHLGWDNPGCTHRLGNEMLESSAMEIALGVPDDDQLNMSQQCPGTQEGQPCPEGHQAKHHQPIEGGD